MADQPQPPPPDRESARPLLELVRRLRAPDGCPWDRAQTHASLRPYVIEEAHEVAEALDSGDPHRLREELGDLLLQIALHAVIAEEQGHFGWQDIVDSVTDKLVRRHPHVFGEAKADTPADVARLWQAAKSQERAQGRTSALDGIPGGLPALQRAWQMGKRAADTGFDWPDLAGVWAALEAELQELTVEIEAGRSEGAAEELGDVLFTLCNVARFIGVEPEGALGRAVVKFSRRFRHLEDDVARRGQRIADLSDAELDRIWQDAKAAVKTGGYADEQE